MGAIQTQTTLLNDIKRAVSHQGQAVGYQKLTVNGTAATLTIPDAGATSAIIIIESTTAAPTVAVRYREDGTAPTSAIGMPVTTGTILEILHPDNLTRFSIIEATGATTYAHITYFR